MRVRIIPSTRDGKHQLLTSYLINETLAIDAGALAIGLTREEQLALRAIVITHTHLDHTASLPLLITDLFDDLREPIALYATPADFDALRQYIFNPRIWITLETLRNDQTELLEHRPYRSGEMFEVEGLKLLPIPVTHTVLTHGLLIEDETTALLFTSDTGATDRIWQVANECEKLKAVFIDLSFPNALTDLARVSHHHSPETLVAEMKKLRRDVIVYGVHLKAPYRDRIVAEVAALNESRLRIADVGRDYEF
ncbi:MAG: 3',5'-cyclic-nucleotide phosphodiesterase [Acidobacteriota bacterium]